MPRTGLNRSPALAIELESPQSSYLPDDIVLGKVVRGAHVVSPRGWVNIKLLGRAKSKMTVSNGQNKSVYRGRYTIFQIHEKLFDGPIHVPPNGEPQSWPFAIAIPKGPSPPLVATGHDQKYSNLSLKEDDIAKQPLPATFYYAGEGWSTKFHGYVEYYIEAELRVSGSGSPAGTATLPISVRPPSTPIPITDFDLKGRSFGGLIKTQRLVPGQETAELSFKQKTQKFFGSSKVPEFVYSVEVDYPAVIQMGNPNPIPFRMRILPNRSRTTDIISDVHQTVTLTKLMMEIKANTAVLCQGTFTSHDADKTVKHSLSLQQALISLGGPITIPSGPDAEAIDIGALLDLRLDARRAYAMGKPLLAFQSQLAPSFTTYNIKHSHRLKWEAIMTVAGETMEVSAEYPVSLLAPSEEQEIEANNALSPEEKRKKYEDALEAANLGVQGVGAILQIIEAASG